MKVTQVAIRPTDASNIAGRPALTPELLAASGARYSRNNEGLEAIIAKIDPENLDKSVDSIFKMIDYGHQSIADMVPVAMFIDGISIWLAYYLWSLCPTAGGQESSTRYIKISQDSLVPADDLGLSAGDAIAWQQAMDLSFDAYRKATVLWQQIATDNPEVLRIPKTLADDTSDKAQKQVARMRRNFAFDRSRYFLPAAAATNVMLIMSARAWAGLCQYLLSHPLPEAQKLGELVRIELELAAPRMLRHATSKPSVKHGLQTEFECARRLAEGASKYLVENAAQFDHPDTAQLHVMLAEDATAFDLACDLSAHDNRYSWVGNTLRMTAVRFGWEAVAFAEIRDINRHRTGSKSCPLVPVGFYCALDQISDSHRSELLALAEIGRSITASARQSLQTGDPTYVYSTLLGTQFPFEHVTTADKFIYEAELRTGIGAHYRYAKHLHDVLQLWYDRFPATRTLILEGSAEPE